jgi:hypothetical protein
MDIYGYHWWFPFHEIPWAPRTDPQNQILVALTPRTKPGKKFKVKELGKNQLFCHENQHFFEGFEIP